MINHPFEIIVVDDGSTDEITGSSFSEEIRYIRKEHSGRIETRLRGLQEAKYPYVLFIDARVWINLLHSKKNNQHK
jgi:glycosyltransferase involved in cell wall biosynthesis